MSEPSFDVKAAQAELQSVSAYADQVSELLQEALSELEGVRTELEEALEALNEIAEYCRPMGPIDPGWLAEPWKIARAFLDRVESPSD